MGCGASKQPPPDLSAVNGGMTKCMPGSSITTERSGYILKQKMWSWSGDDFKIKDDKGNEVYTIKGNALSLRDRMIIMDSSGSPVALLQKKLMALRDTFQLYTYGKKIFEKRVIVELTRIYSNSK